MKIIYNKPCRNNRRPVKHQLKLRRIALGQFLRMLPIKLCVSTCLSQTGTQSCFYIY